MKGIRYRIDFFGVYDNTILQSIYDASDLVLLSNRPPASLNSLRYRAMQDMPEILKVMRAYGYYDADVHFAIDLHANNIANVSVFIDPGVQYTIGSYEILSKDCKEKQTLFPIDLSMLDLCPNSPAYSQKIIDTETLALQIFSEKGYPLAKVEKRDVIVDMETKKLDTYACIESGPLSRFGPISIIGLKNVKPSYIYRRVGWKTGDIYNISQVDALQRRLLDSNLFGSVLLSHADKLDENGELPIQIRTSEAKHKQVSLGAFYATVDGPGGVFTWTHKNLRGVGESFSIQGEYSKRYLTGICTYKIPDFLALDQRLRLTGQIEKQKIYPFDAFIYRAVSYFDWKNPPKTNLTLGLELQHLNVNDSANNGTYLYFDTPFFIKYNRSDDIMNPTRGYSVTYQPHFFQSLYDDTRFLKQRLLTTFYIPLYKKNIVFAVRGLLGSILGAQREKIALPILFLGGSDDDLRGYRYLSVSPLDSDNKPLGGRSAFFSSFELRLRIRDIGIVPFSDFGTLSESWHPKFDTKWYRSWGVGLRYFTSFGPLRFDVGFPLNKRKGIDSSYRIYASIGQAF